MTVRFLYVRVVVSLAACGGSGSDLDPGAGDNPAAVPRRCSSKAASARRPVSRTRASAAEFDTEFSIRILLNQVPVTTAPSRSRACRCEVPARGSTPTARTGGPAVRTVMTKVYILDIVFRRDNVHDVRVDGPTPHGSTSRSRARPSTRRCRSRSMGAQRHRRPRLDRHRPARQALDRRLGHVHLPAGSLQAEKDQPKENTIRLERVDRVIPAGGGRGLGVRRPPPQRHHDFVAAPPAAPVRHASSRPLLGRSQRRLRLELFSEFAAVRYAELGTRDSAPPRFGTRRSARGDSGTRRSGHAAFVRGRFSSRRFGTRPFRNGRRYAAVRYPELARGGSVRAVRHAAFGTRPFGTRRSAHGCRTRRFGTRPFGTRPFGTRRFGTRPFGTRRSACGRPPPRCRMPRRRTPVAVSSAVRPRGTRT